MKMNSTTMLRIPKDISNRIDIIKALHPKEELNKEGWAARLLNESLQKYEKKLEKHKFV